MKPNVLLDAGQSLRCAFGDQHAVPTEWLGLLRQAERGIERADRRFTADLTALAPRMQAFARTLTRDTSAAEDLVQDTMLRAWRARHRFVPGSSLRAWTFTILRRVHITNLRRRRFIGTYDDELERTLSIDETQSITVELADVQVALERLPDDQRTALSMIVFEHLPYDEVAHRLGVAVGTVKSRVSRARRALAAALESEVNPLWPNRAAPALQTGGWR